MPRLLTLLPLVLAGCAAEPASSGMPFALRDPLGVLDDLDGPLRLLVLDTREIAYSCDPDTGEVSPTPIGGDVQGAVVDLPLTPAAGAVDVMQEVNVPPGDYVIFVTGTGVDAVSRVPFTALGCAARSIEDGQTQAVDITLRQMFPRACGDGVLGPEEQCDDDNEAPGDGCDADCRTEPLPVNTTTDGAQTSPAAGWATNQRLGVAFRSDFGGTDIYLRVLGDLGQPLTMPAALSVDGPVDMLSGIQDQPSAAVSQSRIAVAFADASPTSMGGDVLVRFISLTDRSPAAASARVTATSDGMQLQPHIAAMSRGDVLVVFNDSTSATGISGRTFGPGTTTPAGSDAFEVGSGIAGVASASAAAGHAGGFVVALAAGGDVFVQQLGADGSPDGTPQNVATGPDAVGNDDQPSIAALDDGSFFVAWRSDRSDAAAGTTAIRGRAFSAAGTAVGGVVDVNTTTDGDQELPSVAAAHGRFVVAWRHGPGGVRGRLFDAAGTPARNREPMPSSDDFAVTGNDARAVSVAAGGIDTDGRFSVVWEDRTVDASGNIQARSYPLP